MCIRTRKQLKITAQNFHHKDPSPVSCDDHSVLNFWMGHWSEWPIQPTLVVIRGNFLQTHNETHEAKQQPHSKVHGANMGPTWVLSAPDGPHVGPINLVIRVTTFVGKMFQFHVIVTRLYPAWWFFSPHYEIISFFLISIISYLDNGYLC